MQVRLTDDEWGKIDLKLSRIKKIQLSFFFLILAIVLSVFLYIGILYFIQKENQFSILSHNNQIEKSTIISKISTSTLK